MNVTLLFVVFAAPVLGGAVWGWLSWWLPRRRLDRLFRERAREAVTRLPVPPVVVRHLEAVA